MIIQNPNLNFNGMLKLRSKTDYIVIHNADAAVCTVEQIHKWHLNNNWSGIGYHFFVRKDGSIYRGRPLNTIGAHVTNYNSNSIGICAEGAYNSVDKAMPNAQKQAIIELIRDMKTKYPNAKIVRHKDLMATSCPGQYFPWDDIKNLKLIEERIDTEMIYNYVDNNMPEWARPTIQKLIDKGFLKGNEKGELELNDTMLKIFVINDRAGLYGA